MEMDVVLMGNVAVVITANVAANKKKKYHLLKRKKVLNFRILKMVQPRSHNYSRNMCGV